MGVCSGAVTSLSAGDGDVSLALSSNAFPMLVKLQGGNFGALVEDLQPRLERKKAFCDR